MADAARPGAGARRLLAVTGAAGLLIAAAGALLLLRGGGPPARIVLIVADTLRRDALSPYAPARNTPHIAALAARGQVFPNAFAAFHQTSMSMGSLFTGRTPSIESGRSEQSLGWNGSTWCGMARFAGPDAEEGVCLPESIPTLGEQMRQLGYRTLGIVANQFLFDPAGFSRGFDDWVEVGVQGEGVFRLGSRSIASRSGKHVTAAAIEAIDRRDRDRFFLYVHYMDAHDYGGRPEDYAGAVARIDLAVGRLLSHLERADLLEDAIVVLTADHGERLRERHALPGRPGHLGNPSFQEVLRVPLIVAPPVVDDPSGMVRVQDLFYLLQRLGGGRPERSTALEPGELYVGERRYRTYLRGRWKSVLPRDGDGPRLFDLARDPGERRDVAADHPEILGAHRERIDALSRSLAADAGGSERGLSPRDEERLRALGYLE